MKCKRKERELVAKKLIFFFCVYSNRLRSTRTARVEQSEEDETEIFLGYEGEDFKFEHVDNELEFVSCSVENKDIEKVQDWIRN